MATATEPKHADTDGYVDFDEFIDYQLTRTRSGIKSTDLLTALIGGAAAVLAYVLVFALFDHWVVAGGFSTTTRIVLLSLLLLGLVGWTVWKLVLPYFRTVTPLYAARQIEQTQPDLQNSLMTLVDLKRSGRPVPEAIEDALEKRSALNLSHMDVEQAVDRRLLMRLSYVLLALVVLTCAYVLFSPKKLSNSLWRAMLPASNVAVATRTRIDEVDPGDAEVLARAQLTVTADISGQLPDEVTLLFTTADRRFVDEPVAMRRTEEGLQQFRGVLTGENGAGILQDLTYHVRAGDATSDEYRVIVKQPPSATVQDVHYEYPDYMGLDARTQPGGAIDAWEGTWVRITARANMPLKSAMVLFSDSEDTTLKAEEFPAEIEDGVNITARWQLRIRSDGTHAAFYRIQCQNEAGEIDIAPTLQSVKIRPDLPPRIQLVQPTGDIERPANAIVPLLYAAEDPDFLLRSVVLHMELNGEPVPQQPRLFQAPPFRKSLHDVHNLELEALELNVGDRLTYWLQARDNMQPFADRSGNRANTPRLNITIAEPAAPEQVQQQLEEDQQQIAEKLDEAQQQPGESPADPREQPGEMSDDTDPPPANDNQPPESGDPQQSGEASETQQGADSQPGDSPQQQGGGQGATENQPANDGQQPGEGTQGREGAQQQDGSGESQPGGEESFDDLLKKLMQRQQQQKQQEPGNSEQPQSGQPQQSPQQPGNQTTPNPGTPQNGQAPQPAGENSSEPNNPGSQQPSSDQQPSGGNSTTTPGDAAGGSPESMNSQPSAGEGTAPQDTSPPGENPSANQPQPGTAPGGEKTTDPSANPPTGKTPDNDGTSPGGQKQPGSDPTGAKPGDGNPSTDGTQPGTMPPAPTGDQPGPQPGEATDNPPARSGGQPDGADEPMKGAGDPEGQRSDRPQTGEGGNAQQTSQGNKGGEQQGPGDSTGQKGTQESGSQKTGQPGSEQPGAGSQQQPGGNKPGSEGAPSGQQPGGDESSPSKPSGGGETPLTRSEDSQKPGMQEDSSGKPAGEPADDQKGDSPQGGGEQSGGQKSEGGPSEGPQSGGESGQGGQPGEGQPGGQPGEGGAQPGGQPGAPPSGGSPSGAGSGTQSDGGQLGPTSPDGQGGGGEGPMEGGKGDGAAGEGSSPSSRAEEADLEAKRKAANLVLQQLQDQLQRGEIDPDLQQDLNLTPEQLRSFTDKLQQRLAETAGEDTSPEAQARRQQFEETLRTIDYDSKGTTREGGDREREAASGFSGPNRQAPPQLRDATRLYRERLQQRQNRGR